MVVVYCSVYCVGTQETFCFYKKVDERNKNIFLTLLKQCLKKIPRDVDKADFFVVFFISVFL